MMHQKLCVDIESALVLIDETVLGDFHTVSYSPPEKFEQDTGLEGVAYQYQFPDELDILKVEKYVCFYADFIFAHSTLNDGAKRQRAGAILFTKEEIEQECYTKAQIDEIYARPLPSEELSQYEISQWQEKETEHLQNMNILWEWFCDLNPDLNKVLFDQENFFAVEAAIFGVTSKYNPDDIQQYIDHFFGCVDPVKDEQRETLHQQVFQEEGLENYGFPSLETLKIINKQLAGLKSSRQRHYPSKPNLSP